MADELKNSENVPEKGRSRRWLPPYMYPKVWALTVEAFYGDEHRADVWMRTHCDQLGEIPLELLPDKSERSRVLTEIERIQKDKLRRHPITAWHASSAVRPSPVNGDLMFRGTKVPVCGLIHDLGEGKTIYDFLKENPGVTLHQIQVLFERLYLDLCDF